MKKLLPLLLMMIGSTLSAQISDSMLLHANYDDNNLPARTDGLSYNDIWGYANDEGEFAIMGTLEGTMFIDVTYPTQPVLIDHIPGGYTNSVWRDFKTYKTYAYGVADETSNKAKSGLQVFDLSDLPNQVQLVHEDNSRFERAHNLFIDVPNARIYFAGTNTRSNGLIVMDLSRNAAKPEFLSSVALPGGYVHDVFVRDNIAYCSHGFNGLWIYDFTNPKVPVLLGNLTTYANQGYNHSSWLTENGDFLVFADESHGRPLRVLDVSDLSDLSIVSTFQSALLAPTATNSIAHNPFIRDDLAFISYYHEGVQVFDISDPLFPVRVGYYDTEPGNTNYSGYQGCWGIYPFLPSGNILASDVKHGLFVLQLDNWPAGTQRLAEGETRNATALPAVAASARMAPATSLTAYPNPATSDGVVHIRWAGEPAAEARIRLLDVYGREMLHRTVALEARNTARMTLPQLAAGLYWLESGGQRVALRVD